MSPVDAGRDRRLPLREYQREALAALNAAWSGERRPTGKGAVKRPAVVLPTGMGKTVIFSHGIAQAHAAGTRPLVLVHREELAQQAKAKLHDVMPGASIGIVKADRDETDADVIVGSVPTLARASRRERLRNVGLVIADECHHAAAPSWRRVLEHFGAFEDSRGARAAGFTATMDRGDGAHLGDVWQEVVFRRDILDGVRGGFLVNPVGRRVQIADLELDAVRKSRGDWQAGDLGDALTDADAATAIAEAYSEHARYDESHPRAGEVRPGVVFAPTVQTAYDFAEALNAAGIVTEVVEGDTPAEERARIYDRFRTGETRVLSNCMVLTEGWDAPWAEVAVIARPTQSASLYVQMVGRVLRPWPEGGKRDALVLDVVGVTGMHSLATLAVLTSSPVDQVKDGESLAEAVARTANRVEAGELFLTSNGRPDGMLVSAAVDLFAESTSVWLQTIAGRRWFIPTKETIYFLHEDPATATWSVGRVPNKGPANVRAEQLEAGLSMTAAMSWAESYAAEEDPSISGRRSSWRRKPVTQHQTGMLARLGIPPEIVTGWRQGQVSDLISMAVATMRLDFRTTDPRVLMGLDIPV
jgi:superfamily II DNA or RNA helicase